jgi:hypothetical protein
MFLVQNKVKGLLTCWRQRVLHRALNQPDIETLLVPLRRVHTHSPQLDGALKSAPENESKVHLKLTQKCT